MGATKYWSVDECCWVDEPAAEALDAETVVPQQRTESLIETAPDPVVS